MSNQQWRSPMSEAKPFVFPNGRSGKHTRSESEQRSTGVDEQTIKDFEKRLKKNLYKIWNRMSSGSYFPHQYDGEDTKSQRWGKKTGIPTVSDRIAQQVVRSRLEPEVDRLFHADSYGYRPGKSALDAVGRARERCWRYDWV